ncbi:MAG: Clp protease N-terminal domain-containing protein, partial [Spirochaetia bacterium]
MRVDKLTLKAQEALETAQSQAHRYNHALLDTEHLLFALVTQRDGVIIPLLERLGVPKDRLQAEVEKLLAAKPKQYGETAQISLSPQANNVLYKAEDEAAKLKDEYVSTEHLFMALLDVPGDSRNLLEKSGVTREAVLKVLREIRGNRTVTDQSPEDKYRVLDRYCRDLTDLARKGKLDPVIGRDEEIRRIMQVLSRR